MIYTVDNIQRKYKLYGTKEIKLAVWGYGALNMYMVSYS